MTFICKTQADGKMHVGPCFYIRSHDSVESSSKLGVMIQTIDHREIIDVLLQKYGLAPEQFEIVPNVKDWCNVNDVHEEHPGRIAKCLCRREDGACHIVMLAVITDEMIKLAKDVMDLFGFDHVWQSLDTDERFLIHTVLHEIACHVLRETAQAPRDEWAFKEMKRLST